jgi:hypothetical protein
LTIKKIITLLCLNFLILTSVNGATANCSGGECEFNYSHHYKYAKTNCFQNLSFEEVETTFMYFTILKTKEECRILESQD